MNYGEDQLHDHNNIINLVYWQYFLNTMKLVIQILNFTFMLAIVWIIFCDYTKHKHDVMFYDKDLSFEESVINNQDFLTAFGFD